MDWVLEHIWVLLAVAGGIAQMLMKKKETDGAGEAAPPADASFDDPMLAERTRKIREDIQRKIEERRRGGEVSQPVARAEPVPEPAPEWVRELPPVVQEVFPSMRQAQASANHLEDQRHAELLEQQATLVERLRQAEAMKAAVQKRTSFETAISEKDGAKGRSQRALIGELRDPAALRRAFVLREVLGPPVALRR